MVRANLPRAQPANHLLDLIRKLAYDAAKFPQGHVPNTEIFISECLKPLQLRISMLKYKLKTYPLIIYLLRAT